MSDHESPVLKKGVEIAQVLSKAGLQMKECTVVNKGHRMPYMRGDLLTEMIEKNVDKISKIYAEEQTLSAVSIAQKLLKDNLLIRLERFHEEKKYYWPRKLVLTNVSSILID